MKKCSYEITNDKGEKVRCNKPRGYHDYCKEHMEQVYGDDTHLNISNSLKNFTRVNTKLYYK